jgi:hypothetical protein
MIFKRQIERRRLVSGLVRNEDRRINHAIGLPNEAVESPRVVVVIRAAACSVAPDGAEAKVLSKHFFLAIHRKLA